MVELKSARSGIVCVLLALPLALFLNVAPATAATITFEGVAPPGSQVIPATPHTEGGFTFVNLQGGAYDGIFDAGSGVNTNGTAIFGWCSWCIPGGHVIQMTSSGGIAFNLTSIDVANLQSGAGQSIVLVGSFSGGGTVTATLPLTDTWTTHSLPGFTSLLSVTFAGNDNGAPPDPAMDNIVANEIPEPATGMALLLGFALLAATKRR